MLRVEPQIIDNYVANGTVQLAFWHVLDHGPSLVAHQAAECAGAQNPRKFWQMHDRLFAQQIDLWRGTEQTVHSFAADLGLDSDAFAACMADPSVRGKVTRMDQERRNAGIRLRPTFAINDQILPGAQPYETVAATFDAILAQE